ncbi:MAG: hypothetical protein ACODAJ_14620 [Planctomycetota bacterium]
MPAQTPKTWSIVLAAAVMGLVASQASGLTVTVDGSPSDWGITLGPGGSSSWEPLAGVQGTWGGAEDYTGGDSGFVSPGWGGQGYDAEAVYFTHDVTTAYFAVVTGFPPSGRDGHEPGDIALDIGSDSTWDFGIETTGGDGHARGGLYATDNDDWKSPLLGVSKPWELTSSAADLVAGPPETELAYLNTAYGSEHYFIEAAIPLIDLPLHDEGCTDIGIHWTMSCGNDAVNAQVVYCPPTYSTPSSVVPEPASCTLLGGGLLVLIVSRVRRRSKSQTPERA